MEWNVLLKHGTQFLLIFSIGLFKYIMYKNNFASDTGIKSVVKCEIDSFYYDILHQVVTEFWNWLYISLSLQIVKSFKTQYLKCQI